ncbi:hypothetical protein [Streptomyces sp. NPDC059209]|uniref:hypothetical protein n=1 Tax=Streptomyces sp. NPDC059209 TaxID=3346769 RepID=UPI00368909AC
MGEPLAAAGQRRAERLGDAHQGQAQCAEGGLPADDQRRERGENPDCRGQGAHQAHDGGRRPRHSDTDSAEPEQPAERPGYPPGDTGEPGQDTREDVDVEVGADRDARRAVRADPRVEVVQVRDDPDRDFLADEQRTDALNETGQVRGDRQVDRPQGAETGQECGVEPAEVRIDADGQVGGGQAPLDLPADRSAGVAGGAEQRPLDPQPKIT